jgi:hypothetical protein
MPLRSAVLALVALGLSATAATAQPDCSRYYFVLFGGQGVPFVARTAHTWAVHARVTPTPEGLLAIDSFTISWLPADANVQPLRVRPVPGRNWTHEETLAIMSRYNSHISYWGPYEITCQQYALAVQQYQFLTSGEPVFRAVDSFNLNRRTVNCVHAVTHAEPVVSTYIQPVIRVGEPGTSRLAKLYVRHGSFPNYPETADWLVPALGLDRYPGPIVRREPGERIPRRW